MKLSDLPEYNVVSESKPKTLSDLGDYKVVEPKKTLGQKIKSGLKELFPNASKVASAPTTPMELHNPLARVGKVAAVGALDMADYPRRRFGSVVTGRDVADPETGLFAGYREGLDKRQLDPRGYPFNNIARGALKASSYFLEDPLLLLGAAAKAPQAASAALNKADAGSRAIRRYLTPGGREAMESAAKRGPEDIASRVRKGLETEIGAEEAAIAGAEATRGELLAKRVLGPHTPLEPLARGEKVQGSLESSRKAIGQKFETAYDDILSVVGGEKVPTAYPLRGKNTLNQAQKIAKEVESAIEWNPGRQVGSFMGKPMDAADAAKLDELVGGLGDAKDLKGLLARVRYIQSRIKFDPKANTPPLFREGSGGEFAAKEIQAKLRNLLDEQIDAAAAKAGRPELASTMREARSLYHEIGGPLGQLKRDATDKGEEFGAKLHKLGAARIRDLVAASQKHSKDVPELSAFVDDLRGAYMDNFIQNATKDGSIDFKKAASIWRDPKKLDPQIKRTLMTPEEIKRVDAALARFENTNFPQSPIGIGGDPLGTHLRKSQEGITASILNINDPYKRKAAQELAFLDALQGNTGNNSLLKQAEDFADAMQLGMTPEGKIPLIGGELPNIGALLGPFGKATAFKTASKSPYAAVQIARLMQALSGSPRAASAASKAGTILQRGAFVPPAPEYGISDFMSGEKKQKSPTIFELLGAQ